MSIFTVCKAACNACILILWGPQPSWRVSASLRLFPPISHRKNASVWQFCLLKHAAITCLFWYLCTESFNDNDDDDDEHYFPDAAPRPETAQIKTRKTKGSVAWDIDQSVEDSSTNDSGKLHLNGFFSLRSFSFTFFILKLSKSILLYLFNHFDLVRCTRRWDSERQSDSR